ncbi:MAG: hypothetical protein M1453_01800 [Acidobacteria bacterium]|nr:hypothetical protein [Acidobacteriota bacterium]
MNQMSSPEQVVEQFLVPLWRGEDAVVYERIKEDLHGARIPFYEMQPEEFHQAQGDPYRTFPHPRFGFELLVMPSQLDSARVILERILNSESEELEFADDEPQEDAHNSGPQKEIPENWDESEAKLEIWTGADEQFAFSLRICLRENAIPSRLVLLDPGNATLFVRPEDETRAREILREITEGTPLT